MDINKISEIRKKLNLTQMQLAKLAGVSQSLIAKVEAGDIDPAYSKVLAIFGALENEQKKKDTSKKAIDVATKNVAFAKDDDKLEKIMKLMKEKSISQLPVLRGNDLVGSISDDIFVDIAEHKEKLENSRVQDIMQEAFPTIPEKSDLEIVTNLLHYYKAVLVKKDGKIAGIITKSDLIKAIRK